MGTPGWEMAARAALTVICRGATSKLGARSVRREEWSHSPNERAQPVLRYPNNPDLLCLLLDNKEEGGIFISLYMMTAAPHLREGVPFCSTYMGCSPVSPGGKRGDLASLPYDKP